MNKISVLGKTLDIVLENNMVKKYQCDMPANSFTLEVFYYKTIDSWFIGCNFRSLYFHSSKDSFTDAKKDIEYQISKLLFPFEKFMYCRYKTRILE